jgi:hypothetical protein
MELILTHKPRGIIPPETMAAMAEQLKKLLAKPDSVVPGGKVIASYAARAKSFSVCIWDVPTVEALYPFLEQLTMAGWETDVIPAEKMTVYVEKRAKALQAMKK